jgi:formylglycine-generating enzyme required for sulfatase activity
MVPYHNKIPEVSQQMFKVKIIYFLAILIFTLILFCAKIESEHTWNNPLDPDGTNYSPPQIISINDKVFDVFPVKKFNISATGTDDKDSITEYFWSQDNGKTWQSSGPASHYEVSWDTSSIGLNKVLVYITDNHGLKSKIDTLTFFVHRYEPTIYQVKDTTVRYNAVYEQTLKGDDTSCQLLKYYWDKGLDGWDDSVIAQIASCPISKPEGGSLFVHWAIRDESNFVKNDTFMVYFSKVPATPKMVSPAGDTVKSFFSYDYYKNTGSIIIECTGSDPDDADSLLTFKVKYALINDTIYDSVESKDSRLQLYGIKSSSIYTCDLFSIDPGKNTATIHGQFVTPPTPAGPEGMRFIKCTENEFQMGQIGDSTTPVHQVHFSKNFWIDTSEITVEKFSRVLSLPPPSSSTNRSPATNITWFDAVLFCNARSKLDKLDTVYKYTTVTGSPGKQCKLENVTAHINAQGYRLPTEAEWEFACRGGTYSLFFWGNDRYLISDFAWTFTSADTKVHEIAGLKPNPLGLYDMSGNVWEWCNDWYAKDSYRKSSDADPYGPASGTEQVIRGGSSNSSFYFAQSGTRSKLHPESYNAFTGFRTILPIP